MDYPEKTGTTRRSFVAGSLALAAAPGFLAGAKDREQRILIDPCNQIALAGVRLRIKNLASGKKYRFTTNADGSWDFASVVQDVADPNGEEVRIKIKPLKIEDIPYAGLDCRFSTFPKIQSNKRIGHLALIPLKHAGRGSGIDDDEFNLVWAHFLKEALFSVERTPARIPPRSARGALRRFELRRIRLRLGQPLSEAERDFVRSTIQDSALEDLTAGEVRLSGVEELTPSRKPIFEEELPVGTLTVIKQATYPRPAVRLRYSEVNPHEIVAALIILDDLTLVQLFRDGLGSEEELRLSRHMVQRCLAEALGYRPSMRLRNRTLLDANFDPPARTQRQGIRPEDILLSRVLYGARCLIPGSRWSIESEEIILTRL